MNFQDACEQLSQSGYAIIAVQWQYDKNQHKAQCIVRECDLSPTQMDGFCYFAINLLLDCSLNDTAAIPNMLSNIVTSEHYDNIAVFAYKDCVYYSFVKIESYYEYRDRTYSLVDAAAMICSNAVHK